MNERTEMLLNTYKPELMFVLYKAQRDNFYIESHDILANGNVAEGKPLKQETLQAMIDVFYKENIQQSEITGVIPENILLYKQLAGGNYKMVWYRPAEIRVLQFAPQLKLPCENVWVPAMLYFAQKSGLKVYAMGANTRPKENSKIFTAPFHNVNDGGGVCLGNAKVAKPKQLTFYNVMKYWEDLFWLSEFTHLNGENKTVSAMDKVWKKMLTSKTKLKWSDIKELKPWNNYTFKYFIKYVSE